jgi:hypothetical protein
MSDFYDEYKTIREALIALLCVGDEVVFICRRPPKYEDYTFDKRTIMAIEDDGVILQTWAYPRKISMHTVEHHEGQIYFFEDSGYPLSCRARRKKMLKILEHKWKKSMN